MNDATAIGAVRHPIEYRTKFPAAVVAPQAKAAIEWLIPPPISRQALLDLFDGRASYAQAKQWRFGIRRLTPWAAAILDSKLEARMAPAAKLRAQLRAAIGPGYCHDPTGANLRKQKAGQ